MPDLPETSRSLSPAARWVTAYALARVRCEALKEARKQLDVLIDESEMRMRIARLEAERAEASGETSGEAEARES